MDAVGIAARAIKCGRGRADDRRRRREHDARAVRDGQGRLARFRARPTIYDTTIGWRFVNPLMKRKYGVDSMPETAENVAVDYSISRADQDAFALRSQQQGGRARSRTARLRQEIIAGRDRAEEGRSARGDAATNIRAKQSLEALGKLKGVVRPDGTVTAGNASGVNDGACALLLAERGGRRRIRPDAARPRAWAWRPPASRRASWASARRRRRRSCSRSSGLTHRADRRDRAERGVRGAGPGGAAHARRGATTIRASIRTAARSRSAIRWA